MKKNLLLTCLLTLVAALGMAQVKATFPITLTEAEGLPGPFVVQNYLFKSETYQVDTPIQKLRMTVCNTNTANDVGYGSHDGISAYDGPGQPFFTMSEVRFFDENGKSVSYVANANSVDPGDGGGVAALSDENEGSYLHTNYSGRCWSMPYEYHYVEFELEKEVSTFYFTIQTRSKYYKNLITYMGITAGSADATEEELAYVPFPEQQFQLGEKVASIDDFAEEGALFVMQGSSEDWERVYSFSAGGADYERIDTIPGDLYMRSPYESTITPSAASVFYLVPDADGTADTYRVCWLNSGRYIAKHQGGLDIWTHFTRDITGAAALTISPCDEGGYYFTCPGVATVKNAETGEDEVHEFTAYLGYDAYGRMDYIADSDSAFEKTARPHSYNWTVYKASINGAAIASQLQEAIDEAEERLEAGRPTEDDGEYDALVNGIKVAKYIAGKADATASEIITMKRNLTTLTTAYAIVSLWAYADSINKIEEMADDFVLLENNSTEWVPGAYMQSAFDNLLAYMDVIEKAAESCETIAEVDQAIENLYAAIATFWGSQIPEDMQLTELPFRVGRPEDGLPGVNIESEWIWQSPTYYFAEEVESIRLTVFGVESGRADNHGKPFVCLNEIAFYDGGGVQIPMTEDCYSTPYVHATDGIGLAGLCDGKHGTDKKTHFHSLWGDGCGGEYFYLDIVFPEPITAFSYKQWGRGNSYPETPIDFVFGFEGEPVIPEDVLFPVPNPYGVELGEPIASADEITDDGLYALVGNWNAAPEYTSAEPANPIYFSGLNCYGPVYAGLAAPCAYRITKTDNDSTFNIFSLATNKYFKNNGGPGNYYSTETSVFEEAAKVRIVPSAQCRAELGAEEFENAFFIYQFNDTIIKEVDEFDEDLDTTVKVMKPHPYLMLDSWGTEPSARLVWRAMYGPSEFATTNKDGVLQYFQGELEWLIYKMTMEKPNLYWLQAVYAEAAANEMFVGTNPGWYTEGSIGAYANALAKAQAALESNDEATAIEAIAELEATKHLPESAEKNPVTAGIYVIESYDSRFEEQQGAPKVLCSYFNRNTMWNVDGVSYPSTSSEYSLWWAVAPEDYFNCNVRYQFELIPAVITEDAPEGSIYSEILAQWYTDSVVTEEQLANAFFIKSVETGQYAYVSEIVDATTGLPKTSQDIGFSDTPEYPYIFRLDVAYKYDIWCPVSTGHCFHMLDHSNGAGSAGTICHWNGAPNTPSLWKLNRISGEPTSINNVADAEGEVVSVSYYTADGAAVAAPVKGINIVKKTYANGVVKTTKEFVK